ncbi:MAG: hypothetical protein HUK22_04690, partial [Thermoguttaceae bacterium]|nr:hypothetical protein [Thermoguttaceae bacterium]
WDKADADFDLNSDLGVVRPPSTVRRVAKDSAKIADAQSAPTLPFTPSQEFVAKRHSLEDSTTKPTTPEFERSKMRYSIFATPRSRRELDDEGFPLEATPLEEYKKRKNQNSQFIPVAEAELGASPGIDSARSPYRLSQLVGAGAGLIGVVALFVAAFQTPSPDALYRRVEKKVKSYLVEKDSVHLRHAEKDLQRFVELYPNDFRAKEARYYLSEIDLEVAEQRLERQYQSRSQNDSALPIERAYIETLRLVERDPEAGAVKLRAFINLFESPDATNEGDGEPKISHAQMRRNTRKAISAPPEQLVEIAQRRLDRLEQERENRERADLQLLNDRLEAALSFRDDRPKHAVQIRDALKTFYKDKPWAQEALQKLDDWESIP